MPSKLTTASVIAEFTGSDVVLEAILEADVAHHAKEFFKQPEAPAFSSGPVVNVQK
jgi:hypothetical protein